MLVMAKSLGPALSTLGIKVTADDKFKALELAGVHTIKSPADIGKGIAEVTGW